MASFLSPRVFSLVPAYIGYLGGRAAGGGKQGRNRLTTFTHGLAFVFGFSVVFVLLGASASAFGSLLYDLRNWVARIGGIVVVIIFGLHMTGVFRIAFLEYDVRIQGNPDRKRGYITSFLMGIFFSAGWSPCIGPVLGSILILAINSSSIVIGTKLSFPALLDPGGTIKNLYGTTGVPESFIVNKLKIAFIKRSHFPYCARVNRKQTLFDLR